MTIRFKQTACAAVLAAAMPALAQSNTADTTTLAPVTVTANGIPTRDSDATYASEVHDRAAIEASGAASVYDYLARFTGLNVLSGGNSNAPLLDMRGYGLESGYENLVVVVDGYRLNNLDQTSPYLGGIPLDSVESIEISKGSGSVRYGDGAMAGVIQIRTRARTGASISAMGGSHGAQTINASAGLTRELFDLSVQASNTKQASLSAPDVTGARDGSDNRTQSANLTLKPNTDLKLFLGGANAHVDTHYVGSLTPAQFAADPEQNGGNTYNHQIYESNRWRAGFEYALALGWTARYMHDAEDKRSEFVAPWAYRYDYNTDSDDLGLAYRAGGLDLSAGVQRFKADRTGTDNVTHKDNTAVYARGAYRFERLTLSAGIREERVAYRYMPTSGTATRGDYTLNAADLGTNYRFNEQWSVFANANQAFSAPDIDRFFKLNGTFNGLIEPAKTKNYTLGMNRDTPGNRLRLALFRSNLRNEIYYTPTSGTNTNIDKSHKYGLELNERWQASRTLALSAIYTYTKAIIDNDVPSGGAYNGNAVPGVPRQGLTLGVDWQPWHNAFLNVTQTWRESSYAISNFANDDTLHRQSAYNSTSISLRQRWKKIEAFIGIDNLFDRKNGEWVYANYTPEPVNVYPVDFRRTVRVGFKADLF